MTWVKPRRTIVGYIHRHHGSKKAMVERNDAVNHKDAMKTARHPKRMPGVALAAAYVVFCALPAALAAARTTAPLDPWERTAAALGLAGLAAMAVQFVTSGRFQIVSGHLGIDKIMAFHKVAARWVLLALLLHPLFYVLPTWLEDPDLGLERLVAYLTLPHYRSGVVALLALSVLVVTAILREWLPWRYEFWRGSHLVLGMIAVGAALHHAVAVGRFSAAGPVQALWWVVGAGVLAVVAVLYGWRWFLLRRRPWRLTSVAKVADRMWELDLQPAHENPAWGYEAGQFVWMTEGRRRFPLFDHPFSIADSPLRPGLSLIVKEAGDFTNRVGKLAPGTAIGIDGPYGDFTLDSHQARSVLLLAGGVGIAPIMGLLRDMVARRDPRPVRLGYAVGRPANFACLPEIEAASAVLDLQIMLLSEKNEEAWTGPVGRLDRGRLAELLEGLGLQETVALICGPGPMTTSVSNALLELGLPMKNIVYERFDYGSGPASRQDRRRSLQFAAIGLALALTLFILSAL
ncbi:ferredoxin reductase family protein [Nitratireductor sp. ZSWI3]|uniref:ferredoxin reductase family protein n=1 Tax=Nitratireductor sp. ZSWI3 TaxID=2966359 RepID=UPI00214FFFC9|nr:ferredoxin reductase family protein [Nitratireductor sp. ZSWI3]MCR4269240.1 ferredoxin reductase family protein [Nitratireductor sp. ZSWI3]